MAVTMGEVPRELVWMTRTDQQLLRFEDLSPVIFLMGRYVQRTQLKISFT